MIPSTPILQQINLRYSQIETRVLHFVKAGSKTTKDGHPKELFALKNPRQHPKYIQRLFRKPMPAERIHAIALYMNIKFKLP